MKVFSLFFAFFILTFGAFAQDYKKISDPSKCKAAIQKKQSEMKSLTADFKESVYSEMFDQAKTANGKLNYKKSDKIRWEHTTPTKKVLLINGSKIKYSENGKEVTNPTTKIVVKKIQNLMVKMMNGNFLDGKEFSISYEENSSKYRLTLTPTSDKISKYIESIVLIFDKKDFLLKEMTMLESETEKIVYTFSNTLVNPSINDSKFTNF